jgi:hypothetical protein
MITSRAPQTQDLIISLPHSVPSLVLPTIVCAYVVRTDFSTCRPASTNMAKCQVPEPCTLRIKGGLSRQSFNLMHCLNICVH